MPIVRQESFAGGELSPKLWARTRHSRYAIGARGILNFIATPFGDLANRPGNTTCEADTLLQTCVAVGTNTCAKSDTGETWATKSIPASPYRGVAKGRDYWVAVGSNAGARSADGDTWTGFTLPAAAYYYDCCWADPLQLWIAVCAGSIASSPDTVTWTNRLTGSGTAFYSIAYGNGRLVTVGNTTEVRVSTDGKNWAEGTLPAALGLATSIVFAPWLYGGSGGFLAVGYGSTDHVGITRDGFAWETYAGLSGNWQEVAVNNDDQVLVAVANAGTYRSMKSTDGGQTWTDAGLPSSAWASICWQGSLWVAVGSSICRTSPDTTTWTSQTFSSGVFAIASAYESEQLPQKRLIPFVFSDDQTLVLEFGDEYIRFIENGAYVESGGSPYELATPYGAADLPRLKYAQMGNIITLTHPDYTPRELERTATVPLTFTLTTIDFDVPISPADHSVDTQNRLLVRVYPTTPVGSPAGPRWRWTVTAICKSVDGRRTWETKVAEPLFGAVHEDDSVWDAGTGYVFHNTVKRYYSVDNLWRSYKLIVGLSTGDDPLTSPTIWEPIPPYDFIDGIDLTSEAAKWQWGYRTASDFVIVGFNFYRGLNDLFGLLTFASRDLAGDKLVVGSVGEFNDIGYSEPDYSVRPPKGENPFEIYDEDGNVIRTEDPTCVAHHDGRLVFGGTAERPNYILASRLGDWHNFDQYPIVKADDSIIFGLAGRRFEEIRSMISGRSLLVFTTSGEWAVDGGQPGQPIQPTSLSARQRTERGSTWLDALKVGDDHALFVQRKGTVVRDLAYNGVAGTYQNNSVSLFSQHLFQGKTVVDWCWQEDPWSVVWAALSDGSLVSLTFLPEEKVLAWARHEIGGDGVVESICSIPEGEEDAIYMVVRRGTYRGIERMNTRQVTDAAEGIFLDSSLSFEFGTATTAITGLDHLEGESVYALADGLVQGPFTVASGAITLDTAANRVHVGLKYNSDYESLDCPPGEGKTRVKAIREAWVEVEASAGRIQAGETFDDLETWSGDEADEAEAVDGLVTGQIHIPTISTWNHGGRVCVRQSDPLPCTILAVARDVEYG